MTSGYDSVDSAFINIIRDLLTNGHTTDSRNGPVRECLGAQIILENINHPFLMNERRKLSPYYACAELLWYLSGTDRTEMIEAYAPSYKNYAEDGTAHGAYGQRLTSNLEDESSCGENQLDLVIELLRKDPDTRQAVITFWDASKDLCQDYKDIPCTLSLQFLIRNDVLVLITTMRSNDVWLGLPYDIFAFTCIQRLVAQALGIQCGSYVHQAGSLHLYEKNWKSAAEAMENPYFIRNPKPIWETEHSVNWKAEVKESVRVEKCVRKGIPTVTHFSDSNVSQMMFDLVSTTSHLWTGGTPLVTSFDLLKGISNVNN